MSPSRRDARSVCMLRVGKLHARSRPFRFALLYCDNQPSSACHASAVISGCGLCASYACKPSLPHSRHFPPLRSLPTPPRLRYRAPRCYAFERRGVEVRRSGGMSRVRNTEDSAPYEKLRTQPTIDAEAWQAEIGLLSKRERRNEVRSERDRASIPTRRRHPSRSGRYRTSGSVMEVDFQTLF